MPEGSLMFRFEGTEIQKLISAIKNPFDYVLITAGPTMQVIDGNPYTILRVEAEVFTKKAGSDIGRSTGVTGIGCPVPPCRPTLLSEGTDDNCEKQLLSVIEFNKKIQFEE